MPASSKPTKQDSHPAGHTVEFYEDDHRYSIKEKPDIEFTSATTWIGKFFPEFDREGVSLKYSRKHNIPQQEVLAMWDEKGRVARERGTLIHAKAEESILHFLNNSQNVALDDILTDEHQDGVSDNPRLTRQLIQSMHQAVTKMSEVLDFVKPEQIIACPQLALAGMVDLVVKLRTDSGKNLVGLYDWKTNEKITKHNPWQSGFTPIDHLSDCNFIHYSLQLNLYEYICRREGYFPADTVFQKVLIHLSPDGYETHKCENYQHVIQLMLEHDGKI